MVQPGLRVGLSAILLYAFVLATVIMAGGPDPDHDVGADHDHDADGGSTDGDHDQDADGVHHHGGLWAMRGVLGLGKCPVAVIVLVFLLLWGTTGLVAHAYLRSRLAENGSWFWLSLAITLVVAVCGTGLIVRAVARIMPTNQSYGSSTRDLIGRGAEVLFEVGAKAGTVRLTDQFKNTLDFKARAQVGTGPL